MSQQDLAELCELSVDQIANIERGKSFAGETTIAMLADAFKVSQRALFDYTENQVFVKGGGMKWRAGRKSSTLRLRDRKVQVTIQNQHKR